jgi:mono/diheme cytochrome c family protein
MFARPFRWRFDMACHAKHKLAKRLLTLSLLPLTSLAAAADAQDDENAGWGSGQNLYEKVCAHCHAPEVGVGTAIAGRGLPEAYIKVFVRNGINAMPSFPASFIDDESIALVAAYLASLPPASPTQP